MSTEYYRVDPEHSGEYGREVRCFGPPGTGKTTFLSGSVRNTALLRGGRNVVVASFTVTAAAELQGRGLPLPKSQIGTLHSLAYRQLDRPPVADELLPEWNRDHPVYEMTLRSKPNVDDGQPLEAGVGGATPGDALASEVDSLRARRVPREQWPAEARAFGDAWEAFKRANGCIDFTDMIEHALTDVDTAPGNPDIGFFDEVQDFTPLELALIRKWGQSMERIVMAGDDDQSIYAFKGASPEAFLTPEIPDADKIVLSQSYRIPASVHRAAEHWIRQVGHRQEKLYLPRTEEGLVRHVPAAYNTPKALLREIDRALDRAYPDENGVEQPGTVMVLASCAYMLDPIKHEMRAAGLPFHNPYRRTRGDWNPLGRDSADGKTISSRQRLLAYLALDERAFGDAARPWTGEDIRRWTHVVKKRGIFARGAAAAIDGLPNGEVDYADIAALFADDVELEQAVTPDLEWLSRNLLAGARAGMAFPIEVARKRGARALTDRPRVVLGTIHSVKGGQADTVLLIPDLSARGSNEWRQRGEPQDSIRRQMYVGMTRARHELVVLTPGTGLHVSPEQIVAGAREGAA